MASVTSATSSVEYNESHPLIIDLQNLLCDTDLSLHSAFCEDGVQIALHTQLLRARSPFFDVLLRPPWSVPSKPLSLPFPSAHINDILEYLITGHVRLDGIEETLALGRVAHLFSCDSLVAICAHHLRESLTPELLPRVLALASKPGKPDVPLPEPFEAALRQYVAHTPEDAMRSCLLDSAPDAFHARRSALLLLAHSFHLEKIGATAVAEAALGIAEWAKVDALRPTLAACSDDERKAVADLLCAAPPRLFACCVENSGAVPPAQILDKFRTDALTAYDAAAGVMGAVGGDGRFVRCESAHPHLRGVTAVETLRKVRLSGCESVILRFDPKSSIGKGGELLFYESDPTDETHSETHRVTVVSGALQTSVSLSRNEFWFGLNCPVGIEETEEEDQVVTDWGWLFYVYPVVTPDSAKPCLESTRNCWEFQSKEKDGEVFCKEEEAE